MLRYTYIKHEICVCSAHMLNTCVKYICSICVLSKACLACVEHIFNMCENHFEQTIDKKKPHTYILNKCGLFCVNQLCAIFMLKECSEDVQNVFTYMYLLWGDAEK